MTTCHCGAPARIKETRLLADGERRRKYRCAECLAQWSVVIAHDERRPHRMLAGGKVLEYLRREPGITARQIAQQFGVPPPKANKWLAPLLRRQMVVRRMRKHTAHYWSADQSHLAQAWDGTGAESAPTPPPTPPQLPMPAYVGEIVRGRPVPERTPERVEYRQIDGRPVKVTICPSVRAS